MNTPAWPHHVDAGVVHRAAWYARVPQIALPSPPSRLERNRSRQRNDQAPATKSRRLLGSATESPLSVGDTRRSAMRCIRDSCQRPPRLSSSLDHERERHVTDEGLDGPAWPMASNRAAVSSAVDTSAWTIIGAGASRGIARSARPARRRCPTCTSARTPPRAPEGEGVASPMPMVPPVTRTVRPRNSAARRPLRPLRRDAVEQVHEPVDVRQLGSSARGTLILSSRIVHDTTSTMSRLLAPSSFMDFWVDLGLRQLLDGGQQVLLHHRQDVFTGHVHLPFRDKYRKASRSL